MAFISGGGIPRTSQVTVTTTATPIFADRSASGLSPRSAAIAQQAGSVDVTIGGSTVTAGMGIILRGNPDNTTQPAEFNCGSTDKAIYAIVASGTGTLNIYEEY